MKLSSLLYVSFLAFITLETSVEVAIARPASLCNPPWQMIGRDCVLPTFPEMARRKDANAEKYCADNGGKISMDRNGNKACTKPEATTPDHDTSQGTRGRTDALMPGAAGYVEDENGKGCTERNCPGGKHQNEVCPPPMEMVDGKCTELHNSWAIARNPSNSYDQVGLQHNQILADFVKSTEGQKFKADLIAHKMRPLTDYFVPFFNKHCPSCPGPYNPIPPIDFAKSAKSPDDWIQFYQKHPSEVFVKYVHLLENNVRNLSGTGKGELGSAFFGSTIRLEAKIAADKEVSEGDRRTLLMVASGIRYSYAYWNDPNNGWEGFKVDWGRVAGIDGIGMIGGPESSGICSAIDLAFQWSGN